MASYVYRDFVACFLGLPKFTERVDVMTLDISSQKPVFGSRDHSFRRINAYSINSSDRRVHSVPPEILSPDVGICSLHWGT